MGNQDFGLLHQLDFPPDLLGAGAGACDRNRTTCLELSPSKAGAISAPVNDADGIFVTAKGIAFWGKGR